MHIRKIDFKYFGLGLFLLITLFSVGAIGRVYLFDFGIIYNYGFLLSIGYKPFVDFTTPLLPALGLVQLLAFNIFGYNYLSGVLMALLIVVIEYVFLFAQLKNIIEHKRAALFGFLITISGVPLTSSLYYNHILLSLISTYFVLSYIDNVSGSKNQSNKYCRLFLISFLLLVKIHWGFAMLAVELLSDLFFGYLNTNKIIKKYLVFGLIFFIFSFVILFVSNQSSLTEFFINVRGFDFRLNVNLRGLVRYFLCFPNSIFDTIEINPFILTVILASSLYIHNENILKSSRVEVFYCAAIVFVSFVIVLNSMEPFTILLPLQILLLMKCEIIISKFRSILVKRALSRQIVVWLWLHFVFCGFCVINGSRKSYDEKTGVFGATPIRLKLHQNFGLTSRKAGHFFKGVSLSKTQISSFNFVDSILSKTKTDKIYFGPELEILNIVYRINPIKGFPLWVHPGLTTNLEREVELKKLFSNQMPEVIFLSKKRKDFLLFLDEEFLESNDFVKISGDDDVFIDCYLRGDRRSEE
jgi:hypothetical protein